MFRKTIFWLHLVCGVVTGIVVGILCFTGAALAFEKQIIAWSENGARQVAPPAPGTPALPIDELVSRIRTTHPGLRLASLTIDRDATSAVTLNVTGRNLPLYADPFTAALREPGSERTRTFMHLMRAWHTNLHTTDAQRSLGRAITGACNVAFLGLAITGLYLWWPRSWRAGAVRAVAVLNVKLRGKARDFNWHNAVGLWSAPVLIVLTLTAVPMSYRWANAWLFRLAGSEPPAPGAAGFGGLPALQVQPPAAESQPLGLDALVQRVQQDNPAWELITVRVRPDTGRDATKAQTSSRAAAPAKIPAAVVTLKEAQTLPRTATTTLSVDPYSGETLRREDFGGLPPGRRARTWARFLHTGEALGWVGQLLAGLACVGGVVLMYTGLALSWRRFFVRRTATAAR